jgi:hypothetical protein
VQYPVHTTVTLQNLNNALQRFHNNKEIFIDLGICTTFNLPKLHFSRHYIYLITLFDTTDNYNTEYTKQLHIDFAKDAYQATNHRDCHSSKGPWLEVSVLSFFNVLRSPISVSPGPKGPLSLYTAPMVRFPSLSWLILGHFINTGWQRLILGKWPYHPPMIAEGPFLQEGATI